MDINIQHLAWYSYTHWSAFEILDCFKPIEKHSKDYWINKFDQNILLFFGSLDDRNKTIFIEFLKMRFNELYLDSTFVV